MLPTLIEPIPEVQPLPWEHLYPKQMEIFNCGTEEDAKILHPDVPTVIVAEGARKSTKTYAVHHRFIRHIWETPGARAAIVVKLTKSAVDGGLWQELIGSDISDGTIHHWLNSPLGMRLTTADRQGKLGAIRESTTRTELFRVTNHFGGLSEVRLLNLEHDNDVREKLLSTSWSCIWFSELALFKDQAVFSTSWMQLRMAHLARWQHLWIADMNPPKEGEDSWQYNLFFKRRIEASKLGTEGAEQFRKSLHVFSFSLADNIGMNQIEKEAIRANYNDTPGDEAREVDGKWVKGQGDRDKHFNNIFFKDLHVVGDMRPGTRDEDAEIAVSDTTTELFTGSDMGDVNFGAGILERRWVQLGDKEISSWNCLESILLINERIETADFAVMLHDKMKYLERIYNRKFDWKHWTDDSATTKWRASAGTYDHLIVRNATGGAINLQGAYKPAGSVRARVRLLRQLVQEGRFFVAAKCRPVIDMFENLSKGEDPEDFVVWNEHTHSFDWITYILFMEEFENQMLSEGRRPRSRGLTSRFISIGQ